MLLSGCSKDAQVGFLGTPSRDTTNQTGRIIDLWNGSWIAALSVGVLVWGLMVWCMIVYRRRRGQGRLPAQVRYNIPLEILYIVVPIMMVAALFIKTAQAQAEIIDTDAKPDLTIGVVAKQWAWDFNYTDSNVYEVGVQGQLDGKPGVEAQLPTLYVPVNKRVKFLITSRDVIHSFWVPAWLYKLDAIPGVVNSFEIVPQETGDFRGKCSELCGEYHSEMLFNVKVVSQTDYDRHLAELRAAGHVGQLDTNLGRSQTRPGGSKPFSGGTDPTPSATSTGTGNS